MEHSHEPGILPSQHHDLSSSTFTESHLKSRSRQSQPGPLRVLQEKSSNPRNESLEGEHPDSYHYEPTSATSSVENDFSRHLVPSYVASQSEDSLPKRSKAEYERDLKNFMQYMCRCQSYIKYRDNQTETEKGSKHGKWPDHLELAFLQALVKWEPMGRKKMFHRSSKPLGRNELIAQSIREWTKEDVQRKQVSSHLQVLKDKVKDDPYGANILEWLQGDRATRRQEKINRRRLLAAKGFTLPSNAPTKHQNALEPLIFDMYVRDLVGAEIRRLHTFTKSRQDFRPDVHLETLPDWQKKFPLLVDLYNNGELNCDVIHAQASIALNSQPLPDTAEISIQWDLASDRDLSTSHSWDCRTFFYEASGSGFVKHSPDAQQSSQSSNNREPENGGDDARGPGAGNLTHFYNGTRWEHTVPFGSSWWAGKIGGLSIQLRNAEKKVHIAASQRSGLDEAEEALKRTQEGIREHISKITAVQEFMAIAKKSDQTPRRIAVIYWTFMQASPGMSGKTRFTNLVFPRSYVDKQKRRQEREQGFSGVPWDMDLDSQVMPNPFAPQTSEQYVNGLDDLSTVALTGLPREQSQHQPVEQLDHQQTPGLDSLAEGSQLSMHLGLSNDSGLQPYDLSQQHTPTQHEFTQTPYTRGEQQPSSSAAHHYQATTAYDPYQSHFEHSQSQHPHASQISWSNYNSLFTEPGLAYQHTSAPGPYALYDFSQPPQQHHHSHAQPHHPTPQQQQQHRYDTTPRSQQHEPILMSQPEQYYQQYMSQRAAPPPYRPGSHGSDVAAEHQGRETVPRSVFEDEYGRRHEGRVMRQLHGQPQLLPSMIDK